MSDSQQYPLNLYLYTYVKDIVFFIEKRLIITIFFIVTLKKPQLKKKLMFDEKSWIFSCS